MSNKVPPSIAMSKAPLRLIERIASRFRAHAAVIDYAGRSLFLKSIAEEA